MVLPLLIIVLLPKVLNTNDPEMRKVEQNTRSYYQTHLIVCTHTASSLLMQFHVCFCSLQEMEQSMNMLNPNPELPDVSEFMTKLFSKGSSKSGASNKASRSVAPKRR